MPRGRSKGAAGAGISLAHEIDRQVGARTRQRRILLGLTQQQLAELIGVTYQQIHKYETGANRLSAGGLMQFAEALDVGIEYFFQGPGGQRVETNAQDRLMLELARNFMAIAHPEHREGLAALARAMAGPFTDDEDGE